MVYHFFSTRPRCFGLYLCLFSLSNSLNELLHSVRLNLEKRKKEKKKKNGWNRKQRSMRKIYCTRLATRVFLFLDLTFLSLGYKFAFLHFSRTLTLSFFLSLSLPLIFSLASRTVYISKTKAVNYAWPRKEREGKVSYLCEKVLHFVNLLSSFALLHSGYGFLVYFSVCLFVCVCVYLCFVFHAQSYAILSFVQSFAITFLYTLCLTHGALSNWSFDPDGTSLVQR